MDCADHCICGDGHRDGLECDLMCGVLNERSVLEISPGRFVFREGLRQKRGAIGRICRKSPTPSQQVGEKFGINFGRRRKSDYLCTVIRHHITKFSFRNVYLGLWLIMGRKVRRDCEPFCLACISDDKKKEGGRVPVTGVQPPYSRLTPYLFICCQPQPAWSQEPPRHSSCSRRCNGCSPSCSADGRDRAL